MESRREPRDLNVDTPWRDLPELRCPVRAVPAGREEISAALPRRHRARTVAVAGRYMHGPLWIGVRPCRGGAAMKITIRQRRHPDGRTAWQADISVTPKGEDRPDRFRMTAPLKISKSGAERWAGEQARRIAAEGMSCREVTGAVAVPIRYQRPAAVSRVDGALRGCRRSGAYVSGRMSMSAAVYRNQRKSRSVLGSVTTSGTRAGTRARARGKVATWPT